MPPKPRFAPGPSLSPKKALGPIYVRVEGRRTVFAFENPSKAPPPIWVMPSPIEIVGALSAYAAHGRSSPVKPVMTPVPLNWIAFPESTCHEIFVPGILLRKRNG